MSNATQRLLIVDDTPSNIKFLYNLLRDDYHISVAIDGEEALKIARSSEPPDLILLDVMMPKMDGYEVCRHLKSDRNTKKIPVLFVTAKTEVEDESMGLNLGAVDYLTKPINPPIVKARIKNHLELYLYRENLEKLVAEKTKSLRESHLDCIQRLSRASEYKDNETGRHMERIGHYVSRMSEQLGMDSDFCEAMRYAAPMHDVGKVAIPDAILLKQGPLSVDEWEIMKSHAPVGAEILKDSPSRYLQFAAVIAANHHERWDGTGYPMGKKGSEIPLEARIMNITDQYDALRSERPYKNGFSQEKTVEIIIKGDGRTMPQQFDPEVLASFVKLADEFGDIYESLKDGQRVND
ncbi:MAG: response regulator [Desulfobulbaceae bacterium]|nr:response regulator [Desulfobulbaceae bacterium]